MKDDNEKTGSFLIDGVCQKKDVANSISHLPQSPLFDKFIKHRHSKYTKMTQPIFERSSSEPTRDPKPKSALLSKFINNSGRSRSNCKNTPLIFRAAQDMSKWNNTNKSMAPTPTVKLNLDSDPKMSTAKFNDFCTRTIEIIQKRQSNQSSQRRSQKSDGLITFDNNDQVQSAHQSEVHIDNLISQRSRDDCMQKGREILIQDTLVDDADAQYKFIDLSQNYFSQISPIQSSEKRNRQIEIQADTRISNIELYPQSKDFETEENEESILLVNNYNTGTKSKDDSLFYTTGSQDIDFPTPKELSDSPTDSKHDENISDSETQEYKIKINNFESIKSVNSQHRDIAELLTLKNSLSPKMSSIKSHEHGRQNTKDLRELLDHFDTPNVESKLSNKSCEFSFKPLEKLSCFDSLSPREEADIIVIGHQKDIQPTNNDNVDIMILENVSCEEDFEKLEDEKLNVNLDSLNSNIKLEQSKIIKTGGKMTPIKQKLTQPQKAWVKKSKNCLKKQEYSLDLCAKKLSQSRDIYVTKVDPSNSHQSRNIRYAFVNNSHSFEPMTSPEKGVAHTIQNTLKTPNLMSDQDMEKLEHLLNCKERAVNQWMQEKDQHFDELTQKLYYKSKKLIIPKKYSTGEDEERKSYKSARSSLLPSDTESKLIIINLYR